MGSASVHEPLRQCITACEAFERVDLVCPSRPAGKRPCSMQAGLLRTPDSRRGEVEDLADRIEDLVFQLFHVHDLNGDGLLGEDELVSMNQRIAVLHYGNEVDLGSIG